MSKKVLPVKWDFRDVSSGIQRLRQFLLGRKYVFHNRFPPLISPRSIPPPDIPRGPDYKYSDQWYGKRDAMNSVRPPVVAPVAQGLPTRKQTKPGKSPCYMKPTAASDSLEFPCPPTPGMAWWFDGHCYFKTVPDVKFRPQPAPPTPPAPPCPPPCPPPVKPEKPCPLEKEPPCPPAKLTTSNPCGGDERPPLSPCEKKKKPEPCPAPPQEPCDPCVPPSASGANMKNCLATDDQKSKNKCNMSASDPCGGASKPPSDPCNPCGPPDGDGGGDAAKNMKNFLATGGDNMNASDPCGGSKKPPLSPCDKLKKPKPCPPPPQDPCDPCAPQGGDAAQNMKNFLATEDQKPKNKC